MGRTTIGSSVITMDHLNLNRDVKFAEQLGIDYLHIDVMDDHMVPRFGLYPEITSGISDITDMKMDLHLMINHVEKYIRTYGSIKNIEYISFHADENRANLFRIADLIRSYNKKPVLVFNLSTDVALYNKVLSDEVWAGVMFMGIHPGVLSQTARPQFVVQQLHSLSNTLITKDHIEFVQVDGAVNLETIPDFVSAGANNLICGSSSLYRGISYRSQSDIEIYEMTKNNLQEIKSVSNER